jgi:CheY-like chemotaxis protein
MIRVLVIEDDPKNARLIKDILESRTCLVIEAGNGLSAMRIINDHVPDLIFIDMFLPGIDGITLTKLIKTSSKTNKIPVIALTEASKEGDGQRFIQAGCDSCISKPFHVKDLIEVIKKHLKGAEQEDPGYAQ